MAIPIERFVLRATIPTPVPWYYTVRGWAADVTVEVCNAVLFPNDDSALPKDMSVWEKVPATSYGSGLPTLL